MRRDRHAFHVQVLFIEVAIERHLCGYFFRAWLWLVCLLRAFPTTASKPARITNARFDHFEERLRGRSDTRCVDLHLRRIHRVTQTALRQHGIVPNESNCTSENAEKNTAPEDVHR